MLGLSQASIPSSQSCEYILVHALSSTDTHTRVVLALTTQVLAQTPLLDGLNHVPACLLGEGNVANACFVRRLPPTGASAEY